MTSDKTSVSEPTWTQADRVDSMQEVAQEGKEGVLLLLFCRSVPFIAFQDGLTFQSPNEQSACKMVQMDLYLRFWGRSRGGQFNYKSTGSLQEEKRKDIHRKTRFNKKEDDSSFSDGSSTSLDIKQENDCNSQSIIESYKRFVLHLDWLDFLSSFGERCETELRQFSSLSNLESN